MTPVSGCATHTVSTSPSPLANEDSRRQAAPRSALLSFPAASIRASDGCCRHDPLADQFNTIIYSDDDR